MRLKPPAILTAAILLAGSRSNPQQGTLTGVYDFGLKETALVTNVPVGRLTNVFGTGLVLDVDTFAGTTLRSKTPVGGFMVGKRFPVADQVSAYLGAGASIAQNGNFSPVVGAGATWKF